MSRFLNALVDGHVLLMDGALGTELQRAGLSDGACGEHWNLTHPERVHAIHRAYREAGARCLLTNTFQSNPAALAKNGLAQHLEQINAVAVAIARAAGGPEVLVLGDIGPVGADATPEFAGRLVQSLRGADALLLETCSDITLLAAVCQARNELGSAQALPILFSLTYKRDPKEGLCTYTGLSPEAAARLAAQQDIAALGVNCGREIGMEDVIEIVRRYRQVTELPLFARPNAGNPSRLGAAWVYPRTPPQLAEVLPQLLEAGVRLVGGCCGTTPAHIGAFRPVVEAHNAQRVR